MKRFVLLFVVVMLMVAALPASADEHWSYWAWHSRTDDDIYCSTALWPQLWWYYEYRQVGGRTVYCDGSESSWGATWCQIDVRIEASEPCYYGSLEKPESRRPAQFFFGVPPAKRLPFTMPSATMASAIVPQQKGVRRCANS